MLHSAPGPVPLRPSLLAFPPSLRRVLSPRILCLLSYFFGAGPCQGPVHALSISTPKKPQAGGQGSTKGNERQGNKGRKGEADEIEWVTVRSRGCKVDPQGITIKMLGTQVRT